MTLSRRHFLFCAPAIVAVSSIMPVRVPRVLKPSAFAFSYADVDVTLSLYGMAIEPVDLFGDGLWGVSRVKMARELTEAATRHMARQVDEMLGAWP